MHKFVQFQIKPDLLISKEDGYLRKTVHMQSQVFEQFSSCT